MTEQTSLYVPADETGMAALNREWLAARLVFVAGFLLAIAFVVWWTYSYRPVIGGTGYGADVEASQDQMDQALSSGETSKEGFMLCRLAIGNAGNFGVVPTSTKYASGPAKTDVRGRYVCTAADNTGVAYALTVDLMCSNLTNPNCASLFTVAKTDGAVLFHRQDVAPESPDTAVPAEPAPDAGTADDTTTPPADDGTAPPQ